MARGQLLTLLLLTTSSTYADHIHDHTRWARWRWKRSTASTRRVPPDGFYIPMDGGGSMLTQIPETFPMGQGEPINAIITGNSDPRVLIDAEIDGGLRNYFLSFGFSGECLGQHSGSDQAANLGDGNGSLNETSVIRWNYGDSQVGACKETIEGGNHFRYWVQDGPSANSGSIFMAVSYELPIALQHDIIPNGYNLGRDWLIGNITQSAIPSANLSNTTTYSASTSSEGYTYQSNIRYVPDLLPATNDGINHNFSVGINGVNACDGFVAVIDVQITSAPVQKSSALPSFLLPSYALLLALCLQLLPIFRA